MEKAGAEGYFVITGDLYCAKLFKKTSGSSLTVLSDPAGRGAALYGVGKRWFFWGGWRNFPSTFVIDKKGVVSFADINLRWTPTNTILEEVRKAAK